MLQKLLELTLSRRGFVLVGVVCLIITGVVALRGIAMDAFPDVTDTQVELVCRREGYSTLDLERRVTIPLENALRGIPGVKALRSVTKHGIGILTVVFVEKTDPFRARQQVFERFLLARESLPEGVDIEMSPMATVMGEIFQYSLVSTPSKDAAEERRRLTELRGFQEWVLAPALRSVSGVGEVNSYGGFFREFQVVVDPQRLAHYQLAPSELFEALERGHRIMRGAVFEKDGQRAVLRGEGRVVDLDELRQLPLGTRGSAVVRVRDVAKVRAGVAVRLGAALQGTEESVGAIVMMLRGANGLEVVNRVKEKISDLERGSVFPPGVKLVPYYDRADIVRASIGTVTKALLEGIVASLVVLFLFLRSLRGALVILLSIPLTLLGAFLLMRFGGIGANLMSLAGMAISIGMIIDATVTQVENVQRRLEERGETGKSVGLKALVVDAIVEVRKPTLMGEILIASTFLPILAFQGIEGRMFTPLALTVILVLLASLALSILVIPVLCHLLLPAGVPKHNPAFEKLRSIYLSLLARALGRRRLVLAVAIVLCLGAGILATRLGSEFMPTLDEGAFDMDVTLHPSASLDQALEVNGLVGKIFKDFPELNTAVGRIGQTGLALDVRGVDRTGYVGVLNPRNTWTNHRSREELFTALRAAVGTIPGITYGFSQPIQCRIDELVAGSRSQVLVKLFGEDMSQLREQGERIRGAISELPGVVDLVVERTAGVRTLVLKPDRARLARHGLSVADFDAALGMLAGAEAIKVDAGERQVRVVLRGPDALRESHEAMARTVIHSPTGARPTLGELADLRWVEDPIQISREDGRRRLGLEFNISGRDLGSTVAEAQKRVEKLGKLPAGMFLTWGGQFENQRRATGRLLLIGPAVLAFIAILLFFTFRSVGVSGILLLNLPFALVGGVLALWLTGQYFSVPASIGFVVLFGVAVLNGMVLMSYVQVRVEAGDGPDGIRQACAARLRPVLMTAAIAMASLLPLVFAQGTGAELQRPLAVVVIGGLFTATLGTLFVLPVSYSLLLSRKRTSSGDLAMQGRE